MITRKCYNLVFILAFITLMGCFGDKDISNQRDADLISIVRDARTGDAGKQVALTELKARYTALGWSMQALDRVIQGEIWAGMVREQLMESLGTPTDIKKEVKLSGIIERWTYETVPGSKLPKYKSVSLEKNAVTSWQT
jgi:hypothetical protein